MANVHVYPKDNSQLDTGRILHSPTTKGLIEAESLEAGPSGRQSSLGFRRPRPEHQSDEPTVENGADIPDIPLRKSSRISLMNSEYVAGVAATLEKILTDKEFISTHRGPINPNAIRMIAEQSTSSMAEVYERPTKMAGSPEPPVQMLTPESARRVMSPEPDGIDRSGARSPSTRPRSSRSGRSRANSAASTYQSQNTSILPALQTKGAGNDELLEPLVEEEIEPGSFDLVVPSHGNAGVYSLETRSEQIFSEDHLQVIFSDPALLQQFTNFLCTSRPKSVPLLVYYLDATKALKAISYCNAIVEALEPLEGHAFSSSGADPTLNECLREKAAAAFEIIARDDLPAYITHTWIQTVSVSMKRRITGSMPSHLRDMSEGLAEVFCLTDPSRHDNPIVFASEEFHKTTQYGMNYVIGRNCRFLQGPKTNPFSVKRIRDKLLEGKEHYETFLNYRRDGSPFMNLLMCTPLMDSRGNVRYFLGAQVDVSGLAKDCSGLESLRRLVEHGEEPHVKPNGKTAEAENGAKAKEEEEEAGGEKRDEFRELAEMFNYQELETVRRHGGSLHRSQQGEEVQHVDASANWHKPRVLLQDESSATEDDDKDSDGNSNTSLEVHPLPLDPGAASGRLTGVYEHYLLVRPYPSLRILFASPSLRVPGILQSHLLSKIGGSSRIHDELTRALADGQGVTAKVRWVSKTTGEGRPRWIHCTPLLGSNGAIGVWMVVIVDEDEADVQPARKKTREPPVVDGKLSRSRATRHRRNLALDAGSRQQVDDLYHDHRRRAMVDDAGSMDGVPRYYDSRPSSPYTLRIGDGHDRE